MAIQEVREDHYSTGAASAAVQLKGGAVTLVKSWSGKLTNPLGHDYPIMSTVADWQLGTLRVAAAPRA